VLNNNHLYRSSSTFLFEVKASVEQRRLNGTAAELAQRTIENRIATARANAAAH
jgi:hypothetical protein